MNHPAMNAAGALGQGIVNASTQASILKSVDYNRAEQMRAHVTRNVTVFNGKIEVVKVANGYIVNIGRTEGYEFESHIATTPEQVNGIIMSQMVAFRLEDA
jgi:hypothetical protein